MRSIKHLGKTSSSSSIDEVLASYAYEWDASGRLTKEVSSKDGQTSYTYDAVSQLTAADYANMPDTSLGYDANGNRNTNGNAPGPMNRQSSDGESSFEYDSNGNMISRTNISTGAVIRYTFDVRDRMTDVTFYPSETGQPTKKVHYEYDPLNRRVSESTDTNGDGTFEKVEYFVNHGLRSSDGDAGDSVALRLNGSGEVTSRYFHGADVDEILAEENISPTGTRDVLWVLTDIRGSARDLARKTDGITSIVNHIKYDAFGQKISESDAAITHLYGYTGREYNEVTKLQYNRARYYDPKLGRWINDDPKGFDAGDANLYRYVGNHGSYASDPSGQKEYKEDFIKQFKEGSELRNTVTDLMDMGNNLGKEGDRYRFWQAHHWYSQKESMGNWLENMSGGFFFDRRGVNDPRHISAVAAPVHAMITKEQRLFWKGVSEKLGIKNWDGNYDTIVEKLENLSASEQKNLFNQYSTFVETQKSNWQGYFFSGDANLEDVNDAKRKTMDAVDQPRHLTGEALESFRKKQKGYLSKTSESLARLQEEIQAARNGSLKDMLDVGQDATRRAGRWSVWLRRFGALVGIATLANTASGIANPSEEQQQAFDMFVVRYRQCLDRQIRNGYVTPEQKRNLADAAKNFFDKYGMNEGATNIPWTAAYLESAGH